MSEYTGTQCKICQSEMDIFYRQSQVPVNSVVLLSTREEALSYPRGEIELGFCHSCGFLQNTRFDEQLVQYSSEYNPTQAHSATFNQFHRKLAEKMIEKFQLKNKKIIEVGCGQGELLELLAQYGNNLGIGFDPACNAKQSEGVTLVDDFYAEPYFHHQGDLLCCKMTLEHIADVKPFVAMTKKALLDSDSKVFYQVPESIRIMKEIAFWDIYYEHCSYFNPNSLARLFSDLEFEVNDVWFGFDDQYLMIEAGLKGVIESGKQNSWDGIGEIKEWVEWFRDNLPKRLEAWSRFFATHKNIVLWGGGSKAVAFLSTINNTIEYVVDIDPLKHRSFIAGTGQEIVAPGDLRDIQPENIIIMNPVYRDEISAQLREMNIDARVIDITEIL